MNHSLLPHSTDITIDSDKREIDIREEKECETFLKDGCGCHAQCFKQFSEYYIRSVRDDFLELSKDETSNLKKIPTERTRPSTLYMHHGLKVKP